MSRCVPERGGGIGGKEPGFAGGRREGAGGHVRGDGQRAGGARGGGVTFERLHLLRHALVVVRREEVEAEAAQHGLEVAVVRVEARERAVRHGHGARPCVRSRTGRGKLARL